MNNSNIQVSIHCKENGEIVIKSEKWLQLMELLTPFQQISSIIGEITGQNIQLGNMEVKYIHPDGTEMTPEEMIEFNRKAQERAADNHKDSTIYRPL